MHNPDILTCGDILSSMGWPNTKILLAGLLIGLSVAIFWWFSATRKQSFLSPQGAWNFVAKPLQKYSFPELKKRVFLGSEIRLDQVLAEEEDYISRLFFYEVEGYKMSGLINLPAGQAGLPTGTVPVGGFPVVIMIRGFVEPEIYQTGIGTQRVGEFLAQNGFITLAPDFLGFGSSDMPPNNSLEERFMRPGQVLELIASAKKLENVNQDQVFIWAHSNGGQIALSVLELSGAHIPTVLWAPVSKPFPYSILYYTDEFEDHGRALRKVVAGFEALYDADEYSIHNYYDWIQAPIQIHQGTADDAVPVEWSQELLTVLRDKGKEIDLVIHSGADHNLLGAPPGGESGWSEAVAADLNWFNSFR